MVVLRRIVFGLVVPSQAVRWGTLTATWRGPPPPDGPGDDALEAARHAALQPYRGFL